MIVEDWRHVPADALAPLYARERDRALRVLQWDFTPIWNEVEQARTSWGLPGFVVRDRSGSLRGMAFYVREGKRFDLGGLAVDDAAAAGALLDGMLSVAATTARSTVRMLVLDTAAPLGPHLTTRGFEVQPHLYLSRALDVAQPASPRTREREAAAAAPRSGFAAWRDTDIIPAAGLLRRAYAPAAGALFAANNEPAEWERYVSNLVRHPGCGQMNPDATVVLRDGTGLGALAMISDIAPHVAHIVQLAVDPGGRRRGLGRALVEEACARLSAGGYHAVTLLVAGNNLAARSLYEEAGFRQDATFVGATLEG